MGEGQWEKIDPFTAVFCEQETLKKPWKQTLNNVSQSYLAFWYHE